MTIEQLKTTIIQLHIDAAAQYVSDHRNEIKLLFSSLTVDTPTTNNCRSLISFISSNRNNQGFIENEAIQFLITNLAFYFKSANNSAFVYTCLINLKDTVLKYRLQAWYQYRGEYRRSDSHVRRFPDYIAKLSKAISDNNEDYTDDVLSDLYSYYSSHNHLEGFKDLFDDNTLLDSFPILREFKKKKSSLDYRVELHESVDKIFTPSIFTEQLFHDKFLNYIRRHNATIWNDILLGYNAFTIRSEVIGFGQANFDTPYNALVPADKVKLYCYFNMRKHYYSSLYLFERCSWIKKLISKEGCLKFVDIGCGPATSGIALTDFLLTNEGLLKPFDYFGVDYYNSMLAAASDFMTNNSYQQCSTQQYVKTINSINPDTLTDANSILVNACYLFASSTLDINKLAEDVNYLLSINDALPRFLLFQNTTDESKNTKYYEFKTKILPHTVLISDKLTIKYNNQRNSFYPPVHESVYFEVLKF